MAPKTINRAEVESLCDRPEARAATRLMATTPELHSDIRVAAIVLRRAVAIGFPVRPIEVENDREVPVPALPVAPRLAIVPAAVRPSMLRTMTVLVIDEENQPITADTAGRICRAVTAAARG